MTHFTPRPYQHLLINYGLDHERCNWFASMGVGKTGAAWELAARLHLFGESRRVLVLAPRRVAISTWPDEAVKWRESFGHLSVATAVGTPDQRLAALRQNAFLTTINYDNIEWLTETYGDQWPFDTVIADESTRLKGLRISLQQGRRKDGSAGKDFVAGQGAKRAKAIGHVAHKHVRRWINMTGSPAPNGLVDVWGQQWFIDGGRGLGNTFTGFAHRWFRPAWGSTREQQIIEPLPYADKQIHAILAQNSITIDAKDWFDIKEPIERHVLVDLPASARKQYREMQRELFTYINDHPLEAFNAGTKAQKLLQLASGSVWIDRDEKHWESVHDEKIEALKSIVSEANGEPVLVAYQFVPDKERILKAFPRFKTLDHKGAQKDFEEGRLPGLVVHPASAGHGLNLQYHCRILIDYSSNFNLELDEQVIERIGPTRQAQIGQDRAVFRYRIVARDTIEEHAVLPRLKSKMSVQDALKSAMKVLRMN